MFIKRIRLVLAGLLLFGLLTPLLSPPVTAAPSGTFQYIDRVFLNEVLDENPDLWDRATAQLDEEVYTTNTIGIGRNCSGSDDYGPTCEDYFLLPEGQIDVSGETLVFVNQEVYLSDDTSFLDVRSISIPRNGQGLSGQTISGDGTNDTVNLRDPDGLYASVPQDSQSDDQDSGNVGSQDASSPNCEADGGFGWAICGLINGTRDLIQFIQESVIQPFLRTDPLERTRGGADTPAYAIWKELRTVANALLVLVFFAIIFGQTLGLDAYTIKKVLPRLVIAAIAIQISFFIAAVAVDITNVIGQGLRNLVTAPLPDASLSLSGWSEGTLAAGGGIAAVLGAGALLNSFASGGILIVVLGLLGAMILVFLTLIFRQLLIILLAVLTPVALAAWVLPNTERFFKHWSSLFLRTLMMYPLIILLFAAGDIFSNIAINMTNNPGGSGFEKFEDPVLVIVALAALIVPMALIPLTFKVAGGLITQVSGLIGGQKDKILGGADGKSGLLGRQRDKVAHNKAELAAGMGTGSNRITRGFTKTAPFTWAAGRKGLGLGLTRGDRRTSRAQGVIGFNRNMAEATKDIKDTGLDGDGATLARVAQFLHNGRELNSEIGRLRGIGDEVGARNLERFVPHVGKQAYQAAALQLAGEKGALTRGAVRGTYDALSPNTAIQADVIGRAAKSSSERNLEGSAWSVERDGTLSYDAVNPTTGLTRLESSILSAKPSDLAAQTFDATSQPRTVAAMQRIIARGGADAERLTASLHETLKPKYDTSATNKRFIETLVGPPPTMADDVNITHVGGGEIQNGRPNTNGAVWVEPVSPAPPTPPPPPGWTSTPGGLVVPPSRPPRGGGGGGGSTTPPATGGP